MKKNLKKNFKRWIAFLLAIVLITTTCVYSSDSFLRAEGEGMDVESQTEPASEEVEVTPTEVEDSESESDSDTDESDSDADDFEEEETDEDEEEVSEGEDAETSDEALDEENVEESDVESEETTEEKAPASGEETGETYSYAIYYYFDGVEDEDARVEKEDGVLGEKILDADSVEKEVTHNDESYELDRIENGEITEEVESNVASVYYVLANETNEEEESESEGEFGYEIRFYYDSKEDEDARVEKEDGVLGEKIFDTDSIEKEVTHNEKKYSLDKIENKNGKITEDETANVVSVYYVLKKVSKFEQTLSVSASDGAEITVAGMLPEGAKVKARVVTVTSSARAAVEKSVAEEGKELVDLKLYDITIWDADGNEIQPDESVTVTITGADVQGDDAAVYHVEGGNAEKVADVASGNNAQFDAEHFSVYGVAAFSDLVEDDKDSNSKKVKLSKCTRNGYFGLGEDEYLIGDIIKYYIEVDNSSQSDDYQELRNVVIKDDFSGAGELSYLGIGTGIDYKNWDYNYKEDSNVIYDKTTRSFTIKNLPYNENVLIICAYEVQESDAGKSIVNSISLVSEDIELEDNSPPVSVTVKEVPTYTVTYVLNGGKVDGKEVENDKVVFSVKANDSTPSISAPTKEGYKFTGWKPSVADIVTEDANYEAQYERNTDSFNITGSTSTYDSMVHKVTVSGLIEGVETVKYSYDGEIWYDEENFTWPVDVTDSDGKMIYAKVLDKDQKGIWTGEAPIKIEKRPVKIQIPSVTKVFAEPDFDQFEPASIKIGGEKVDPEVESKLLSKLDEINKTVKRSESDKNKPFNEEHIGVLVLASEMTEADLNEKYSNFSFEIENGNLTIIESPKELKVNISDKTETYSNSPYSLSTPIVELNGEKLTEESGIEYSYTITSSDGTSEVSTSNPEKIDAGEYTVKVKVSLEGYHDSAEATATLKIEPKAVTLIAPDAEMILGREGVTYTSQEVQVDGVCKGDSLFEESTSVVPKLKSGTYDKVCLILDVVGVEYNENGINPNYYVPENRVQLGKLNVKGTVTYDANDLVNSEIVKGKIPIEEKTYSRTDEISVSSLSKEDFKKAGATFLGWTKDFRASLVEKVADKPTMVSGEIPMEDHNVTLYAVWAKDANGDNIPDYEQFRLIYDLNGSSDEAPEDEGYYNKGNSKELHQYLEEPKPKHENGEAVFLGWTIDKAAINQVYTSEDSLPDIVESVEFNDADITVYGVWAEDKKGPNGVPDGEPDYNEFTIQYKAGKFGLSNDLIQFNDNKNIAYKAEEKVSLIRNAYVPETKMEGSLISFAAWKDTSENGNIYSYDENETIEYTMPNHDVTLEAQWKYLTVSKSLDESYEQPEGGYKTNDEIHFVVTIANEGDVALEGTVEDTLDGAMFDETESNTYSTLNLPVGAEAQELKVTYRVNEDDLRATEFSNEVIVRIGEETATAICEPNLASAAAPHLTVEKTIINHDSKEPYDVGETIEFNIKVINDGALTVSDISIEDIFEEAEIENAKFFTRLLNKISSFISGKGWNDKVETFTLEPNLGEKSTKEFNVKYVVQEEDLGYSGFWNVATAKGTAKVVENGVLVDKEFKFSGHSDRITIKDKDPKFELKKEVVPPTDKDYLIDGKYPVGKSVKYRISVTNTGNTTLDVDIKDTMTATDGTAVSGTISKVEKGSKFPKDSTLELQESGDFRVTAIPRGETAEFTYEYGIVKEDAGKTINNVAMIGEVKASPQMPIEVVEKSLDVEKKADDPADKEKGYRLGETIKYTVTVKNTGNVELSDIKVQDILENGNSSVIPAEGQSETIKTLSVGESVNFYYTYKVVEDDLENYIQNKAVAYVDSEAFESELVESKVEDKLETATLEKNITNIREGKGDNGNFKSGDTIHYEIKVENTGTRTLSGVTVTDKMTGMTGEITNVKGAELISQKDGVVTFNIPSIPSKGIDQDESYTEHVVTITYDYVVQAADEGKAISNTAIISSYLDEKGDDITDTEIVTIERKSLDVTKEIVGVRPNGGREYEDADSTRRFTTGDTIRFRVIVKNDGNTDLSDITVTDTMSGESNPMAVFIPEESDVATETNINLNAGEEVTLIYDYTVRPADISSNIALINDVVARSGDVEGKSQPVTISREDKISSYSVEKKIEPENPDGMYRVGEKISYSIEILNTGNTTYPMGTVKVLDVLTDNAGNVIEVDESSIDITSGNARWENGQFVLNVPLEWGQRVRIDYTYTVTKADEGKTLRNIAYGSDGAQKDSADPVTIEKKQVDLTKEVISKPANGNSYVVDEYIRFRVKLKNTGNVPLDDISIADRLWSKEGTVLASIVADEGQNPFANGDMISLNVGEEKVFEYTYQVKEADLGKEIFNEIIASGDGYFEQKKTNPVKIDDPDPKVSLTKSVLTSPDGDDGKYKVGTTVTYQILVKNTGNKTLSDVVVKDTMTNASARVAGTSVTGAKMNSLFSDGKWEYTFTLDNGLVRGEERAITYDYVIQKEDAGKRIGNVVIVDSDKVSTDNDSDDSEEIVVENRKLTVTKEIRDPEKVYKLGEEIFFDVKVDNEGDVTLRGIEILDEMLGGAAGNVELVSGNISDITLLPGVAVDLVFKYVVQPGDIANNALKNKLTATAVDGTEGEDETDYIKIEGQNPSYSILKSVIGSGTGEDGKYAIGDEIKYEITITNDGNVALPNMTVGDRMENASGAIDNVKAVIESTENVETEAVATWNKESGRFILGSDIPIGGKAIITYSYKVVEEDAGKTIINVAGKPTDSGSKTTQTEIEDRNLIVDKMLTSSPANPARGYVAGERITFDVRVANAGNVTLSGISIADEMQNAVGKADLVDANGNILNDDSDKDITLAVGENKVLHYSYTVQRDSDIVVGGKAIANKAIAKTNDGKPIRGTLEDTSREASIDRLHTLTVYYQYADGSTAAVTLTQDFAYGDSFAFTIPAIGGYTATLGGEAVQGAVMFVSSLYDDGNPDPVFTVIYNAIPEEEPTATPTPTPDGEGTDPGDDTPVPPTPPVDEEPEEPAPEPVIVPVVPAAVAAPGILGGGAGLVAIGDDPVPLDGVITQDDDGNIVIIPIDEVEVPLANREIDDHKCCILSFLLMLATLVIYSCFTHSMKKRQKKLAELKDQLAEETLKRQLGITDETSSRR